MNFGTSPVGTTDVMITSLGLGGAPLGSVGNKITEHEAQAIVAAAWNGGIRYFDTAPLYGHGLSEKRFGRVLVDYSRDEFVLSTKIGRLLEQEPRAIRYDYSRDAVMRSVEASLERLGLDRIDILLCHDIDVWTHGEAQPEVYAAAMNGALPAMVELRDQGVVRAIGLGVNEAQVCQDVMAEVDVDCFLLAGRFTLLEQGALDELLPACVENEVSVIIGGPYNSGLLASADRDRATYDYKPVSDELWDRTTQLRDMCGRHEVDIRAAALQYPLRHPAVAAVIPGAQALGEVEANLDLVHQELPDALWADLASAGLSRSDF